MDKNRNGMGLLLVFIDNKTILQMYALLDYFHYSGCPLLFIYYFTTCNFREQHFVCASTVSIFKVNISSKVYNFLITS